jgi:AraC-like DNA-binding protein
MVQPTYIGQPRVPVLRPSFRDEAAAENDDTWSYTLPLWCAMTLLQGAIRAGFAPQDLLWRMGAPLDTELYAQWPVPIEKYAAVLRYVARRMGDELIGQWERPVPLGTFVSVTRQMLHCASLGEALNLAIRLYRLAAPGFPLRLRCGDGLARLEIRQPAGQAQPGFEPPTVYWVLSLARWLVDRPIPVRQAWMSSPRQDPRYCEQQPFFELPARYGAGATGVAFDAGWLQRPLARSPESLPAFLAAAPANLMRSQAGQSCAAEQVRSQLLLRGGGADGSLPTLQAVSRTLGLSARSLRRHLHLEGCSYQDLKDARRRELALNWVANSDVALAEVGERLGFSDASTFHRAFKRWTGAAPGEFRRRQRAAQAA